MLTRVPGCADRDGLRAPQSGPPRRRCRCRPCLMFAVGVVVAHRQVELAVAIEIAQREIRRRYVVAMPRSTLSLYMEAALPIAEIDVGSRCARADAVCNDVEFFVSV